MQPPRLVRCGTLAFAALILIALGPAALAQTTTYSYTGDLYTTTQPPYAGGQRLVGSFTVASPLPAFLPTTDIGAALETFSFSDGVETRTDLDSFVCGFEVATDGVGAITRWTISLRRSPFNPGDPHHAIDSSGLPGLIEGIDQVGTGPGPADPCGAMVLDVAATTGSQGSWSSDHPLPSDPTVYAYTGDPYTSAAAPYGVGGNLTGTLTLASPLPPFLALTDIAAAIVSFSFADDVEVRTESDSFVCGFEVATDGAGAITRWSISLRRSPYNPGDPHHSIDSSGQVGVIQGDDLVGTGNAPADPCDPMALTTAASAGTQGSWISDQPLPADPTVYTYTGDPYTAADVPYALGGRLTGSLVLASPLPPFMAAADITAAITSISFSDGVETRTLPTSFLCAFEVATDGAGDITQWTISLRRSPFNPGDPHHSIDSSGQVGAIAGNDLVGSGLAPADPCDPMALTTQASTGSQGTWTSDHPLPSTTTLYTYTGGPYTTATDPPYVLGGRLEGTLELAGALPPFLPLTDITPGIAAFGFFDGVETRSLGDSFLCGFEVATDGAGAITQWRVTLRRFPFTPGQPHHAIDSTGQVGAIGGLDVVGTGTAPADPCGPMILDTFASTSVQGSWQREAPPPVIPEIPTLGVAGVALLALVLAALGVVGLSRRH